MLLTEKGRKQLAKLMVIQDISQRELAEAVGWQSHTILGRLMRGTQSTVTPEKAAAIALCLGVGIDDLFVARSSTGGGRIANQKMRAA